GAAGPRCVGPSAGSAGRIGTASGIGPGTAPLAAETSAPGALTAGRSPRWGSRTTPAWCREESGAVAETPALPSRAGDFRAGVRAGSQYPDPFASAETADIAPDGVTAMCRLAPRE